MKTSRVMEADARTVDNFNITGSKRIDLLSDVNINKVMT